MHAYFVIDQKYLTHIANFGLMPHLSFTNQSGIGYILEHFEDQDKAIVSFDINDEDYEKTSVENEFNGLTNIAIPTEKLNIVISGEEVPLISYYFYKKEELDNLYLENYQALCQEIKDKGINSLDDVLKSLDVLALSLSNTNYDVTERDFILDILQQIKDVLNNSNISKDIIDTFDHVDTISSIYHFKEIIQEYQRTISSENVENNQVINKIIIK